MNDYGNQKRIVEKRDVADGCPATIRRKSRVRGVANFSEQFAVFVSQLFAARVVF